MITALCAIAAAGWALWAHERANARQLANLAARWTVAAGIIAGQLPDDVPIEVPRLGADAFQRARAMASEARSSGPDSVVLTGRPE